MKSTFTFTYKHTYQRTFTITYNERLNNHDLTIHTFTNDQYSHLLMKTKALDVIIICHIYKLKMDRTDGPMDRTAGPSEPLLL